MSQVHTPAPCDSIVLLSRNRHYQIQVVGAFLASGIPVCALATIPEAQAAVNERSCRCLLVDTMGLDGETLSELETLEGASPLAVVRITRSRHRVLALEATRNPDGLLTSEDLRKFYRLLGTRPARRVKMPGLHFDMERLQLLRSPDAQVPMPPRELELLRILCELNGNVASSQRIFDALWGRVFGSISSVTVHVFRLRSRLHRLTGDKLICSAGKKGYYIPSEKLEHLY